MGKRKRQTHLTFEPVIAGDNNSKSNNPSQASAAVAGTTTTTAEFSPSKQQNLVPANVRYSQNAVRVRSHPKMKATKAERHRKRKLAQSKIPSAKEMREKASFMPKASGGSSRRPRAVSTDSSDESAVEIIGAGDDSDVAANDITSLPTPGSQEVLQVIGDNSEDDDDAPLPTSASNGRRSSQSVASRMRKAAIVNYNDDDNEEDEDLLQPPPSSAVRRRRLVAAVLEESEDEDVAPSPSKRRKINQTPRKVASESDSDVLSTNSRPTGRRRLLRTPQILSSPTKRARHKGHRSDKQKTMELLKRRRAGEKITELTESESESDDNRKAVYDTDSNDDLQALKEFDDDEEEQEDDSPKKKIEKGKSQKSKRALWQAQKSRESEGSEDLDDFVVEDDDGPLGAPAGMLTIPLQFTAASHLPLKDQFPYAIEWLVHRRINPAFDRNDPVYVNAWRRLNDEFRGLANSKFASSAWKTEFYRSLKARPKMECFEVGTDGTGYENCEACGRSGHPSTWQIVFNGSAYNNETLDDLTSLCSSDDEDDSEDESDTRSRDGQGMPLVSNTKKWNVGSVCCSNAETAHSLMHWKYHLKTFVEEKLYDQGLMTPEKLAEREKMKPKKRARFANKIVDEWKDKKVVSSLYTNFKQTLEEAQNKSTTGSRGGGGWR